MLRYLCNEQNHIVKNAIVDIANNFENIVITNGKNRGVEHSGKCCHRSREMASKCLMDPANTENVGKTEEISNKSEIRSKVLNRT